MTENHLTLESLRALPLPMPDEGSKDQRGTVLVLGGSVEVPGAALLAGVAALRAGAGRLRIATVQSVAKSMALAVPEARVIGLAETEEGEIDPAQAEERVSALAERSEAVLVGPGLSAGKAADALCFSVLPGQPSTSFVLDAGALCGLAARSEAVLTCGGRAVITPHAGEMAQLLGIDRDAVEADPLAAALRAADLVGCVVIMKGAKTWIVSPAGERWLYDGGGVGLATSGSGDALSGILAGLLARGAEAMTAALWGVFLHGEAGRRLADRVGPVGFLAREIAGEVPAILHEAGPQRSP
ncbi:NAD(P)H-hydrate dehydratase [Methylobacterium oxalidis]|uniref:ADP-dependent (S)-NAD(P)H-hydrate dehydratase n=1 Tax=Methylobacterium oxalidis TaxID=944322 RepID=A0A512J1I7_9HYPH|nr:NAD(P)H-hydrate dehydratase [Methylobacterium oxalidis]GEP03830.1 ADP-dependent (S)-NAD(P)H-hydrate dehydratase [Methylobacterium oxalidis]GJE31296.1 ADP-dependent (S)-NAD(P)H-hydrate dehydratase [Methylobacterium oxalidis]GLS65312.1 ADP-dependent (S)-NAD(P)H-hydrate dehydratase [Methylobacterium oxalidis]